MPQKDDLVPFTMQFYQEMHHLIFFYVNWQVENKTPKQRHGEEGERQYMDVHTPSLYDIDDKRVATAVLH